MIFTGGSTGGSEENPVFVRRAAKVVLSKLIPVAPAHKTPLSSLKAQPWPVEKRVELLKLCQI